MYNLFFYFSLKKKKSSKFNLKKNFPSLITLFQKLLCLHSDSIWRPLWTLAIQRVLNSNKIFPESFLGFLEPKHVAPIFRHLHSWVWLSFFTAPPTTIITIAFHLSVLYICSFLSGLFVPCTKYLANEITFKICDIGNLQRHREKEFPLWTPNKLHSTHHPSQKMLYVWFRPLVQKETVEENPKWASG